MLQLGTAVREIWIRPIHLFTGTGAAGRILDVFMLQLCCCITSDQGASLTCYFLRHHFICCRFHFIKGGTLWLPSSKCLNKYWTYSYGRFHKIAVLCTFPRQAGCWEGNYGAAGAEAGCCRECGRQQLLRGPEISGGWDLLMKSYWRKAIDCLSYFWMEDSDSPNVKFTGNSN